jgi:hypothetical protein
MKKFSMDPPEDKNDPALELDIAVVSHGRKTQKTCATAAVAAQKVEKILPR